MHRAITRPRAQRVGLQFAVASMIMLGVGLTSTTARAAGGVVTDPASCTTLGGSWTIVPTNTCTLPSLTIGAGESLQVGFGTTLVVAGPVVNGGTIRNLGTFITIDVNGVVNNTGAITNDGTITVAGLLMISSTGTVDNRSAGTLSNDNGIQNAGAVTNAGSIYNNFTGTITNTDPGAVVNTGTIVNGGTINNTGIVQNATGGSITNAAFATVSNSGLVENKGALTNLGAIYNNFLGRLTNSGGGTLTSSGALQTDGLVSNDAGSTFRNSGTLGLTSNGVLDNTGTSENTGSVTNLGTINNMQPGSISNLGTITNNGTINGKCGAFSGSPVLGTAIVDLCTSYTVTAPVTQDAFLRQADANKNFGANDKVELKGKAGDQKRGLYQFDLSFVPRGASVKSASLKLWVEHKGDQPVAVHPVTDAWAQLTATWNNTAADFAPAPMATFVPSTTNVTVDITALAQQWVNGALPNNGLMLLATTDQESKFGSRDRANPVERPSLVITYSGGTPTGSVALSREADADTFVAQTDPNKNFGGNDKVEVKEKQGDSKRALYRFDLSYVPKTATVTSAKVRLWVEAKSDRSVGLYRVSDSWTETSATWNNTSTDFDPTKLATFTPSTEKQYITIDITALARQWANGSAPNNGIVLVASSDQTSRYGSRARLNANERPFLDITYTAG